MKPFNLEQALAGAPVRTRDGRRVTALLITADLEAAPWPITARIGKSKDLLVYSKRGAYTHSGDTHPTDLMMGRVWAWRHKLALSFPISVVSLVLVHLC